MTLGMPWRKVAKIKIFVTYLEGSWSNLKIEYEKNITEFVESLIKKLLLQGQS